MLGDACGDCILVVGSDCVPCPNGSDFPECIGCINGVRPEKSDITKDILLPVVIGIVSTLTVALITRKLMR
jgi:hypothetical protein